ncbi:unnamed protein product [Camellia sinensis]
MMHRLFYRLKELKVCSSSSYSSSRTAGSWKWSSSKRKEEKGILLGSLSHWKTGSSHQLFLQDLGHNCKSEIRTENFNVITG